MMDLKTLVEWLGPEGAKSGLIDSDISLKELVELARRHDLPIQSKPTREEIANELIYKNVKKIDKNLAELMKMNGDDLFEYLRKRRPTVSELLSILQQLGIKPSSEDRKHLLRFVAREISDTGMFQRIAQGVRQA